MKTLKEMFGKKETKKTITKINGIMSQLDLNVMRMIKGGEGDDDEDLWPDQKSSPK